MNHTKSPWSQRYTSDHKEILITGITILGNIIASVDSDDADLRESEANANLIVSAPDLLAACEHTVEHHATYVDESGVVCITLQSYAMIVAAVAKAKGK